jgi:sulfur carrier protein
MLLIINGCNENLHDIHYIIDVINHYDLNDKMIVIELNGSIVPQAQWAITTLQEGMKLEIVHFVGGG